MVVSASWSFSNVHCFVDLNVVALVVAVVVVVGQIRFDCLLKLDWKDRMRDWRMVVELELDLNTSMRVDLMQSGLVKDYSLCLCCLHLDVDDRLVLSYL